MEKRKVNDLYIFTVFIFLTNHVAGDDDVTRSPSQSDSSLRYASNLAYLQSTQNSLVTIPHVLDLRENIAFSFRTCHNGSLLSQSGASNSNWLRLQLNHGGQLTLSYKDSATGQSESVEIHQNALTDNKWYTVDLTFLNGEIKVTLTQGARLISSVLLSNSTYRSYLWTLDLSGGSGVILGEGFTGCLQGGPSVLFSGAQFSSVQHGSCPLDGTTGCAGDAEDPCWLYPCSNGGTCMSTVDASGPASSLDVSTEEGGYVCVCPLPYSGRNCESDQGESDLGFCNLSPCRHGGECVPVENSTRKYSCVCPQGYTGVNCEIDIDECVRGPCQNGGRCVDDINGYSCQCAGTGFAGAHCEVNIDECLTLAPCDEGATCTDTPGSYKCVCTRGYGGQDCDLEIDECVSSPCLHGGTCIDGLGYFTCTCAPGSSGDRCETCDLGYIASPSGTGCIPAPEGSASQCDDNPCHNGGECVDTEAGYSCDCAPGYVGLTCDTERDRCHPDPCLNGATCINMGRGNYICDCVSGFLGDVCEIDIDECGSQPCPVVATCEDLVNGFICHCPPGIISGIDCKRDAGACDLAPCQNSGICREVTTSLGYVCDCTREWMGPNCTEPYNACALYPCDNGATCSSNPPEHHFLCTCPLGFTGPNCETNIDDCADVTCPNSAHICMDAVSNYTCECPIGFDGASCDNAANDCASQPCKNDGRCVPTETSYSCDCAGEMVNHTQYTGDSNDVFWVGYVGETCDTQIEVCTNYSNVCLNGGICKTDTDSEYGFACYCPNKGEFFTGKYCHIKTDYCAIYPNPPACLNGATCESIVGDQFLCHCSPGFTGARCDVNVDECSSSPCENNATCVDGAGLYSCLCVPGYTGDNCEINILECETRPCLNGGVCIDKVNGTVCKNCTSPGEGYECNCTDTGYTGLTCGTEVNECASSPCQNEAVCEDSLNDYSCRCWAGYTGRSCETDIDECASSPCLNNGTCVEKSKMADIDIRYADGYECRCMTGFSGAHCEVNIDECEGHDCVHGECVDVINDYKCACDAGYMGLSCQLEIDECTLFSPCQNNARCVDKIADYDCLCEPTADVFYGGKNCSVELTGCVGNDKCLNGGSCIPTLMSETIHLSYCVCPPGFYGAVCEKDTTASFFGDTWMMFDGKVGEANLALSFRFQTTIATGILVLNSVDVEGGSPNYLVLRISDSRTLILDYNSFGNLVVLSVSVPQPFSLANGTWHQANITITDTSVTLALYHPNCPNGLCIDQNIQSTLHLTEGQQLHHNLGKTWFGGAQNVHEFTSAPDFTGCMEDILVDDTTMLIPEDFIGAPETASNLGLGCARTDQCGPNPCNSHGNCTDLYFSFECSCWRPYIGENCSKEYTAATFSKGVDTSSLAMFTLPQDADHIKELEKANRVSFFFRTRTENGLIFYLGDKATTYLAILLEAGYMRVRVRLGGDETLCDQSRTYATNGQQFYFRLERLYENIKFWVRPVTGGTDPTVDDDTDALRCVAEFNTILHPNFLFIGGHDNPTTGRRKRQVDSTTSLNLLETSPFKGTLQDFQQNDYLLQFFPLDNSTGLVPGSSYDSPQLLNVEEGEVSDDMCALFVPCANNATCENVFFNDYLCTCPEGFRGKNCSELDFCVSSECPGNATCNNLDDGYECVTNATFDGASSFVQYSNSIVNSTSIKIVSAVFRTRAESATILHIGGAGTYDSNFINVVIADSVLFVTFNLNGGSKTVNSSALDLDLSDGNVHNVTVTIETGGVICKIDSGTAFGITTTNTVTLFDLVQDTSDIYVGGLEPAYKSANAAKFQTTETFKGCLEQVRIGNFLLPYFDREDLANNTSEEQFYADTITDIRIGCFGDDVCATNACENNATCEDIWNAYECTCLPGYNGTLCENDIDECAWSECQNNATCVDGIANYTCDCMLGYTGYRCEIDIDECESSPCLNNGTCMDLIGRYECNCSANYTGGFCQIDIRESCDENPTLCNNGTCLTVNTTDGNIIIPTFNCSCDPGYEGRYCESAIDYCEGGPCVNNATCVSSTEQLNFTCTCVDGYTGRHCEVDIDECATLPCDNGATCVDNVGYYECLCADGWNGTDCDIDINECNMTDVNGSAMCINGVCDNLPGTYQCDCTDTGYEGDRCESDINECLLPSSCKNNATCDNLPGSYSCNCSLGYEGADCGTPNCTVGQCLNGGTCGISGDQRWYCYCLPFVEGAQCESPGPCVDEPCVNNATCSQAGEVYTCDCVPGWQGQNCSVDVDECVVYAPCQNNATCQNTDGSYSCVCVPGFTGVNCSVDIDECESGPCQNGGVCGDRVNGYVCDCSDTGYNGTECETDVDECLVSSPCDNGGTCTNSPGAYNCTCTEDFVGGTCHSRNPCAVEGVCYNDGECLYVVDDDARNVTAECACTDPWYGPQCEFTANTGPNIALIAGLTAGLVLAALIVALIIVLVIFKDKRATRGTYSPSRQETVGSRVELGNVLKQPPLERLI